MPCPPITNKGGKLYISEEPVDCDLTLSELAVLPYVFVPGVGSIGDTGIEQDIVTYPTTDAGLTPQGKGDATARNWDIEILDRPSQAMDILRSASAVGNNDIYATKIEWPNGDIEYSVGQVSSATNVKGAGSGVRVVRFTIIPSYVPYYFTPSEVETPSGFPFEPPFSILRTSPVTFEAEITPSAYLVPATETYFLSPSGSDANDGLTPATAKKSIYDLVDDLNLSPPAGVNINLAPGFYVGTDGINNASFNFPVNLVCNGGLAYITYLQSVSWTKTAGRTNIWQTSNNGTAAPSVVDMSDLDSDGIERRLAIIPGSDLSVLDATPGSLQGFGGVLYVHLFDGREPDSDVLFFGADQRVWTQTDDHDIYMENIRMYGGMAPALYGSTQTGKTLFLNNVQFNYSHGAYNGFEASANNDGNLIISYNSFAAYNRLDGMGYRGNSNVIEIGVKCPWNGYVGSSDQDNGSTAHNTVSIIRINGEYLDNGDRNIHDVNGVKAWLLGCVAGRPKNGSSTPWVNGNFIFGASTPPDTVMAWLEGCRSEGGATIDLGAQGDALVRYKNCVGFDVVMSRTGGQVIEGY